MSTAVATVYPLTTAEISSILNLVCPLCGGPLGGLPEEYKCQGFCRTDWRRAWASRGAKHPQNDARQARSLKRTAVNGYKEKVGRHRV